MAECSYFFLPAFLWYGSEIKFVADVTFEDQGSPRKVDELTDLSKEDTGSHSGDSGSQSQFEPMAVLQKIKDSVVELGITTMDRVVEVVSNVGNFLQNIFGMPEADKTCTEADAKPNHIENKVGLGASVIGLAIMVIMVVVLKRV